MTVWIEPQPQDLSALVSLDEPVLVREILARRGLGHPEAARAFLDPNFVPPAPFPAIEAAVEQLADSIRKGLPICVWGDFDVDGQTSTAVLVQALRLLGANVSYHVPVRSKEGHGVHVASLKAILDRGARLILTCDTGITAHAAVESAGDRGVPFIITDHHEIDVSVPDAIAVLNPKLLPEGHPLFDLAGAGVAYKLAEALLASRQLESQALLDLVGLGLIADVALLRRETRALAQKGIEALRHTQRLGLRLIAESAQVDLAALTEETIGFSIAPRLNAVGRLSDANMAVELLLTQDPVRGRVLATQIEGLNTQRRLLTEQVFQAAEEQLRAQPSLLAEPILVLAHASWPGGVVGIVAARLVERYRRPAIVLTSGQNGVLRGSARSVDGVHITKAIARCREYIIEFGGHPMAAGLSMRSDSLVPFRKAIGREVETMLKTAHVQENTVAIERWLRLQDLSVEAADELERLAPFGAGNPIPVFATTNVHVKSSRSLGPAGGHRSLQVADEDGISQQVLWWNADEEDLPKGRFDLAFSMRANAYRGQRHLSIQLQDFRLLESRPVEVRARGPELVDLRAEGAAARLPGSCLIWAEGPGAQPNSDRYHLLASDALAIWTAPPSRHDLRAALAAVRPDKIYLVAALPEGVNSSQEFLTRLAGLAKFAARRRQGKTSVHELAAACAHRELTIRLGLEWLAAGGHLNVESGDDEVQLKLSDGPADANLQHELYAAIISLIEETAAYRTYFRTADATAVL